MQQKLSIACAMVHRPEVLIFDEPLVGLDPHAIKELKSIFRELRADGRAVLISTHMIDSVEDYLGRGPHHDERRVCRHAQGLRDGGTRPGGPVLCHNRGR